MSICYECSICFGTCHASHLQCQYCGAVPANYSIIGRPAINRDDQWIEVVIAYGVERQMSHHASKAPMRTVSALYYADADD